MSAPATILLWTDPGKNAAPAPELCCYLLPGEKNPRPAVLVIPGGGYGCVCESTEGEPIARKFNELGFHAFVLQYRVMPYVYPAPQKDALRAIKIIRAHAAEWGIKPDKIAILGFSAGGHLACSAGIVFDEVKADNGDECDAVSARPDAAILCYPVITGVPGKGHLGSFENLLGKEVPREEYLKYSWERRVRPDTPPAFLWHTAEDGGVPVENSLEYALALRQQKIPFAVHIFPDGPHGVGLADNRPGLEDVTIWPELAAAWLKKMEF